MKKLIIALLFSAVAMACNNNLECGIGEACVKANVMSYQGYCAAQPQQNTYQAPSREESDDCYSDYQCGYGGNCVKGYGGIGKCR